ncbi:MAG: ubiquinol-cytochrome c reductase iron-sulfur subunit [Planctomycetaceae bacterium]
MSEQSAQIGPGGKAAGVSLQVQATRRGLLKGVLGAISAFGLGSVIYAFYRFLAPGAGGGAPVEIPLNEISSGGTAYFQYGGAPGILLRGEDGTLRAFSLVCTHLACTVIWNGEKREFHCPCHDGFFDEEGRVLSGPPPAPLDRWKVEVQGNKVIIGAA